MVKYNILELILQVVRIAGSWKERYHMKNKDSKARMQMIFGILLFAFIFMAELYAMVNFPKMFIVLAVLAAADLICLYVAIRGVISVYETNMPGERNSMRVFSSRKRHHISC